MCAGGCEGQAWAVREVFVGWQRGWGLDRDLQRQLAPVPALILGIAETQRHHVTLRVGVRFVYRESGLDNIGNQPCA